MAFSNGYIFGFSLAICVVCSVGVAATATGLKDMQDLNKERDLRSNILQALQLDDNGEPPRGEAVDRLWKERVNVAFITPSGEPAGDDADQDGDGDVDLLDVERARVAAKGSDAPPEVLAVYQRKDGADIGAHGIPVFGKGLWGPISGYLAVGPDGSEVLGATFFAPKETPGLGAEIMKQSFKEQWKGKKLADDGETVPIRVAKGDAESMYPAEAEHWVDGVSGATITCRGVTEMLETGADHYDAYLTRLRTQ